MTSEHMKVQAMISPLGGQQLLAQDVVRVRLPLSNAFLLGTPGQPWVLLDAGSPGNAGMIVRAAEARFGPGARPEAIVLTHGHLDHIGSLWALRRRWENVPIYAHPLELPYLTGASPYPPPDPTVGGSMSALSPLLVPGPFDFRPQVHALEELDDLPALRGWTFVNTPGHSPGHISLWRERDRLLIAGDAFVTTVQESVMAALSLRPRKAHRPPAYYTPDWDSARASVRRLAALRPALAITGHGDPLEGVTLLEELTDLATNFDSQARPAHGRYVTQPAVTGASGVLRLPPQPPFRLSPRPVLIASAALLLLALRRRRV
ncbi:MBL fold metallo-hydrolase [Deinococcus altitudinis]|uniref:MBL fold metallo-hydrolase n=1 Tax=Deinococcus altitudinis TaxID=468914 RepID=UPI00389121F8